MRRREQGSKTERSGGRGDKVSAPSGRHAQELGRPVEVPSDSMDDARERLIAITKKLEQIKEYL